MRWIRRGIWRIVQLVLVALFLLLSPVAYTEIMCQGSGPVTEANPISGETRPEIRTLLTYPEWHIVHAYDDYAEVISQGDPHDFAFIQAIRGYWSTLCTLTEESARLGAINTETKQLVYVIGVSFTFEMAMKALYEETVGRVVSGLRGPSRAEADDLSATQASEYAAFLQQTPWYRYDFRADAAALEELRALSLRDQERSVALGLEHRARAAYADVIAQAVAAVGFDDLTLQMVVAGLDAQTLESTQGVTILREVADGFEVETPRYRELTGILSEWADQGATFIDMAGNDQIMFTTTSDLPTVSGALSSLPRQGYDDTRHLFLVAVPDLASTLRGLEERGLRLEHIHDY